MLQAFRHLEHQTLKMQYKSNANSITNRKTKLEDITGAVYPHEELGSLITSIYDDFIPFSFIHEAELIEPSQGSQCSKAACKGREFKTRVFICRIGWGSFTWLLGGTTQRWRSLSLCNSSSLTFTSIRSWFLIWIYPVYSSDVSCCMLRNCREPHPISLLNPSWETSGKHSFSLLIADEYTSHTISLSVAIPTYLYSMIKEECVKQGVTLHLKRMYVQETRNSEPVLVTAG